MSEITELNRKPDIDGDVISAVSVGADSATVGSLEATDTLTDPSGTSHTTQLAEASDLVDDHSNLTNVQPDQHHAPYTDSDVQALVGPSLNDLLVRNAEQDFELGLTQLAYRDGLYEIYADDSKIANSQSLDLVLGSPINDSGYVLLREPQVGDITVLDGEYTGHSAGVTGVDTFNNSGYSTEGLFGDPTIKKWDVDTMGEQNSYTGLSYSATNISVSDVGVFIPNQDGSVYQLSNDLSSKDATYYSDLDLANAVALDDNYLFAGGQQQYSYIYRWSYGSGTVTGADELSAHSNDVNAMKVDGEYGYSGGDDQTVVKWDVSTFSEQAKYTGHSNGVESLFVNDDIGYSSASGNIHKWDKTDMSKIDEKQSLSTNRIRNIVTDVDYGYAADGSQIIKFDLETLSKISTNSSYNYQFLSTTGLYVYADTENDTIVKLGEGIKAKTNGNVEHVQQDLSFTPSTAVLSDDLRQLPTNTDVYYEIEDSNGNAVTVNRSDVDSEVNTSSLTSGTVQVTAYLERPDTGTASPELDSWAVYFDG